MSNIDARQDVSGRKKALRSKIEGHLKKLSSGQCQQAGLDVSQIFARTFSLTSAFKVAAYWPLSKEIDSRPIIDYCQTQGAKVYLPRVISPGQMKFHLLASKTPEAEDVLGLPCPAHTNPVAALDEFNLMLLPLRGFDAFANRLGTGGGYYDRYLAKKSPTSPPCLVGLAFDEQKCDLVPAAGEDIRLDLIITPSGILSASTDNNSGRFNLVK